jgi:hypothetical protein
MSTQNFKPENDQSDCSRRNKTSMRNNQTAHHAIKTARCPDNTSSSTPVRSLSTQFMARPSCELTSRCSEIGFTFSPFSRRFRWCLGLGCNSSHEPHIHAGDFNAYTAEEIESHITPLDSHTFFRRMGDTNPAHSPASPLTTATAPAADYRGRLLLNMLNSIEFIITNGRFPSPPPKHRPYTFFRKPNTYSILDYNLIAKCHAPLIRTCQVLQNVLPASVTDHMPIYLHLDLPTSSNPVPPLPPHTSPARTLYHSKRLKDPQTKDAYTSALA